ncbi:MAG: DNA-binding transcriptional repressor AcrR [Klebsiella pneumoniae]|nr:DNA-binding transcriptional repressor AcrR [Klebsiella pneumoniae]
MARKTKQQARETRQLILDVALRLFSQQGVNEIWELSDASISDLEIEYRAKFPNDPLSVIREILVYVLEATVTEERRRLMMEIIYHKCEFVGEMTVVQQAQRQLSLASYERIEQTLKECIAAKLLPANLLTRRAAVLMRSYLSGLMENWLFAPDSFDLHAEARDYVAILLEMYQFCPTLRGPESLSA